MKSHSKLARRVLLSGLLLAVAVAWCAPLVQGRVLLSRGDQEDGGYSHGSSSGGVDHRRHHGRNHSSSHSGNHQPWADNDGSDNVSKGDSEGDSDSPPTTAPHQAPMQQPAGNSATPPSDVMQPSKGETDSPATNAAPKDDPAQQPAGNTATSPSKDVQPPSGSTTDPSTPVKAPTTTPTTPATTAPPAAGTTTGGPSDPVLNDVLALHNQLRAKHSAPPLTWSTALEQTAMAWAKSCSHEHSTNRQGDYNELIAWGNRPFTQAVTDEWYSEISKYNFNNPPTSYDDATPHFTQMVWKSTTELGCGYATCSDGPFYVCHYAPTGNTGEYAANVSPPSA